VRQSGSFVLFLLSLLAPILDAVDAAGRTALMLAAPSNPDPLVISVLVKGGAKVNARSPDRLLTNGLLLGCSRSSTMWRKRQVASGGAQ